MNEVTKIHLGRQAFTISADAHKALRNYLEAIKDQVNENEVLDEVELRMAELLTERGIKNDKVVLTKDVNFLKEQLGNPKDFKEDKEDSDPGSSSYDAPEPKKLFRDTEGAMLAGVASGLAKYFGVDVLLIRILFVIGIFTGGWGILLYILLWLLVPEAKTSSERLQMAGKPVTVDSLKEVVERADVKGAARRANDSIAGPVSSFFRILMKTIGLLLVIVGLGGLLGLVAAESYVLVHSGNLFGQDIFPVGFREHLLLNLGVIAGGLMSGFVILFGLAFFKQRWPIRTWMTGTLAGLLLVCIAVSFALAADTIPKVRDRYNAHIHTTIRQVQPFTRVEAMGDGVLIKLQYSDKYSVGMKYFDNPDISKIKTSVSNDGTLLIDSRSFTWKRNCSDLCLPPTYNAEVTVYAPITPRVNIPAGTGEVIFPASPPAYAQ